MLQSMADAYKAPIHELLLANGGQSSSFDRQRVEQAERRAREAELRAQRAEQAARAQHSCRTPPDAPELPPDGETASQRRSSSISSLRFLTAWETNFVADLIARGTRWPSPKQTVVIIRILEKATAFGAASAAADWEDVP